MKKQIILLVTFAMTINFAASANPTDRMIVRIEKTDAAKTIHLHLANLENKRTNISLIDVNGVGWYFEAIRKQNGFATNLDLSGLPIGDFVLLVECNGSQHVQAMSISEGEITFFNTPHGKDRQNGVAVLTSNASEEKGKLITHFSKESKQQASIQLANLLEQPASISLVSPTHGMMLFKDIDGENGYCGIWNLKGMFAGVYFFYVQSSDATVIQFFELKADSIEFKAMQRLERPQVTDKSVISVR